MNFESGGVEGVEPKGGGEPGARGRNIGKGEKNLKAVTEAEVRTKGDRSLF